jgi:hypothetical protein
MKESLFLLTLDDSCKSFIDDTTSLPYFQNLPKVSVADNMASFANSPTSKALSLSFLIKTRNSARR